jgi:long-chain acyl-CoA synthetase
LLSAFGFHSGKVLFRSLREKAGLRSVRLMISGGAALPPKINYFFDRMGFTLMQGYGLTETSPVLSVNRPNKNRIGSAGPALPGIELKIDSPDANGIGEVCARGENVMQGYFENEQATKDVIRDGWFHTGDAGRMDKDGFLYITGRIKNLIVTGAGKNVYPEEIESQLNLSPFILESLVLGLERKHGSGEELFAVILPDHEFIDSETASGKTVDLHSEIEKIVDSYNNSVPVYRKIREWTIRSEPFDKTSTRKIKRYLYKNVYSFSSSSSRD